MRTTADHAGDRPQDWEAPGTALVRSAATDWIPGIADLGRVHIMGIAGSGMSALARIQFDRGVHGQRLRGPGVDHSGRAASARRRRRHRPLPAAPRRHRHVRLHDRHQPPARGARRVTLVLAAVATWDVVTPHGLTAPAEIPMTDAISISPRGRAASWSCAGPPRWKTAGASR
jgi:hypothetical protein